MRGFEQSTDNLFVYKTESLILAFPSIPDQKTAPRNSCNYILEQDL